MLTRCVYIESIREVLNMQDKNFIILSDEHPNMRLRSIEEKDLNHLRNWKNRNRDSFFYKNEISVDEQKEWFKKYLDRDKDFMFIIEEDIENVCKSIGCMGFRDAKSYIDLYNIIRGEKYHKSCAKISDALRIMCSYIQTNFNKIIGCKVLKDNPAVTWYIKNGFRIVENHGEYVYAELDFDKFRPCQIQVILGCEKE